jgi:feruloyl esterase
LQWLPGEATPKYAIARDPSIDVLGAFEPRRYAARIAELATDISANSVDLDRYRDTGGKLIFFHGMVDDYISVYSSIQYFERLAARYPTRKLDTFVRFYTIPGMGHRSGPFNARIAMLDYLTAWVERGHAPDQLVAVDANEPGRARTRPVCRYPAWPRYRGRGDPDIAGSFECVSD